MRKRLAYAFARKAIWTVGLGDEEALMSWNARASVTLDGLIPGADHPRKSWELEPVGAVDSEPVGWLLL